MLFPKPSRAARLARERREKVVTSGSYGADWRWTKAAVLVRDRFRCLLCRAHAHDVHHLVHHGAGGPNAGWNLISLCRPCHRALEAGHLVVRRRRLGRREALEVMARLHGYRYDFPHYDQTGMVHFLGGGPELQDMRIMEAGSGASEILEAPLPL